MKLSGLWRKPRSWSAAVALPLAALGALGASTTMGGCEEEKPPTQLQGQVHLTLLHTSDIHSRLFPYNFQVGQVDAGLGLGEAGVVSNVGGIARISHIIGRERARADRVLHIDGGDCFQGAPVFNFFAGEAEIRSLSAMGADAMLIANHEFDTGARNLGTQLQKWATFPALAANYQLEDPSFPGASPLGALFEPYAVFDARGLRVAVIGMANLSSLTSIFDTPNRLGITPLSTTEIAQAYIDLLRPSVDLIVMISHLGLENDEEMIETTTGIDVVLGGHNHIVLQPPKIVRDCSRNFDEDANSFYVEVPGPDSGEFIRRYCKPRDVTLAHSGAFAKYVGRLDLVVSNDPNDLPDSCDPGASQDSCYDPVNGFEVLTSDFTLFPVNEAVPEDPTVTSVLEPYAQQLDSLANLDLMVGYAPDGSRRSSASGGDSPLGNLIANAMWLRLGIQTDFSLTNTTGIRADLVPGPITVEQMYNVFPFDNSISKMQLSGVEMQDLFDFVARRSASRGCTSQVQIAGARVVIDCNQIVTDDDGNQRRGKAIGIFIGALLDDAGDPVACESDADCVDGEDPRFGQCETEAGICWSPIEAFGYYELATSNYLAGGGSGFRVLQRNTTQFDTKVQQRDALIDYIRQGPPCGSGSTGELRSCSTDADCGCDDGGDPSLCGAEPGTYVCACPDAVIEGDTCDSDADASCGGGGSCILAACRAEVAAFNRETCDAAPNDEIAAECEGSIKPCAAGGEQCKFLACVDRGLGNVSDGRLKMVGQ
ncbi:MAG: bifunctional metallophosphatase/5'-nucleotidase [Polyangiaceae bacterium]|jgi:5'-nucleotidase/UDP-sugar diphosphatase|nr:bifunctional metallophosphatase/5'-nucleotidase [Polyangiaceae bacterium]MBK8939143.1 bifunctional metallophosphatase/5'-nucleotidase [Polyangiaceae bacterium]